jgi:hypothetical protein
MEAGKMAAYHLNSYLTIAADSAIASTVGLFLEGGNIDLSQRIPFSEPRSLVKIRKARFSY